MSKETVTMYDPFEIGSVTVKNRLVRSATFEYGADAGKITPRIEELYRTLSEGGVGLIITGMQAISPGGANGPRMVSIMDGEYIAGMKRITDFAREKGAKLFAQINHAGYKTGREQGDRFGPSAFTAPDGRAYAEATAEEIGAVVRAFGEAAARCKAAGCDGVQIHAAHGFLISSFLSPYLNHRTDEYGGPIENRARILLEAYGAIRKAVGPEYPVGVKINFSDLVTPSIAPGECLWVCKELERRGIDMIEVSSGLTISPESACARPVKDESQEASYLAGAALVAEAVSVPVISVCGYRTPGVIERALNETPVAAVALCRPLVRQPDLPNRWKENAAKSTCISCNLCYQSQGILSCQVKVNPTS